MTPRENTALIGHASACALIEGALAEGRMHHAWLITGSKGIGKATLAYHIARTLLGGGEGAQRRIATGAHPDLLVIEPEFDEKKQEQKTEIRVEQVREVGAFLSLTPAESAWRVVIVDSADALNANGANALLKLLEEPPARAVLLLISHTPARLLPTIRSRCRQLRLSPLSPQEFSRIAGEGEDAEVYYNLSGGAPGLALELKEWNASTLYSSICALFHGWPRVDGGALQALLDAMHKTRVHTAWEVHTRLILKLVGRAVEQGASQPLIPLVPGEGEAIDRLLAWRSPEGLAAWHAALSRHFSLAAEAHLDYKSALTGALERPGALVA